VAVGLDLELPGVEASCGVSTALELWEVDKIKLLLRVGLVDFGV
jgi:hypothetical protein